MTNTMELEINGQNYEFKFGMGFLKAISSQITQPVPGMTSASKNVGLHVAIANLVDGDVEELVNVLYTANQGMKPRLMKSVIEGYIDDECEDIEELFKTTLDFLSEANATKKITKQIIENAEEEK